MSNWEGTSAETPENLPADVVAIRELCKTETGLTAASDLWSFLNNAGCRLDYVNQTRVRDILNAAWAGRMGTVLDELKRGGGVS